MRNRRDYELTGRAIGRAWLRHPKLASRAIVNASRLATTTAAIWLVTNGHEQAAYGLVGLIDCVE